VLFVPFVLPVVMLVVGALRSAAPGLGGNWTASGFRTVYSNPTTYSTLGDSLILASSVTVISISLGVFLAWAVERTNMPLRRVVTPVMVIVFATPSLFLALGWEMLANNPAGLLNKGFVAAFGTSSGPFDVNTWPGLIGVNVLKTSAIVYLLMIGPMRAMDHSLIEASRSAGASTRRTIFRIEIPLLAPAISGVAMLTFVVMLSVLDVPLLIGVPGNIFVYSTQIFNYIAATAPPAYNSASAMSMLLMVVIVVLLIIQRSLLRKRAFVTIAGKQRASSRVDLGGWRWLCLGVAVLYTLAALVLPVGQILIGSFQPVFGVYGHWTLENFRYVASTPELRHAIANTFEIGVVAGFCAALLAVAISYVQRRSTSKLRRLPEISVWMILALPGLVLSLAMVWAYLSIPGLKNLYDTVAMLIISLVVYVTPVAMRASEGAIVQISTELEDAARVSGASGVRTFVSIVMRLIAPSFVAAWLVGGFLAAGNLDVPLLMSGPNNPTLPVEVYNLYSSTANFAGAAAVLVTFVALFVCIALVGVVVWRLVLVRGVRRRSAMAPGRVVSGGRKAESRGDVLPTESRA